MCIYNKEVDEVKYFTYCLRTVSIEHMSTRIDFSIISILFGGIIVVNELGKVLIWFVYDTLDYQTIHVA